MRATKKKSIPETIVDIHSLSHDGRGIADIQGKTTFVHGALAGEKVLCKVTKAHRRYNEGKVIDVILAAPERITPHCAHFGICGGCSLQHLPEAEQLQLKQKTLLEQLKHFGKVAPETIMPPLSGNPWGYRGKARIGVRYVKKKEKLLVGFREKLSNFITDINYCPVLHDSVGKRITALSELIASLKQYEQIPQIEIAVGDDNKTALIIRHLVALSAEDREKCREFAKLHSFELYLQPSSPDPLEKIWPEDEVHLLSYRLPEFNIEIQFHPLSFTQVNREMNPLMIKQAIQWLNPIPSETLLDLYCGLGNFTLPLTRYAKYVTGIEGSDLMVQNAQKNATHNNIDNVDFYAADLTKPSRDAEWMQKTYASILLDPPRTGAKEMLPFFPIFSANKILYVSCNPATLSRDAGELVHIYGYTLKQVGIINMFPHTTHIEAMALFEK